MCVCVCVSVSMWGESGFNCWGVRRPEIVLLLFYVNVSGMRPWSLVLPAFDGTGFLGSPPGQVV